MRWDIRGIFWKTALTFFWRAYVKPRNSKYSLKGTEFEKERQILCHEEVHRLCYRKVTGFHGTRVHARCSAPTRKTQLSFPRYTKITHVQRHYVQYGTEFHLQKAVSLESTDRNAFTHLSKIWLVLSRFSQDSQSLDFCRHFLYWILSKSGEKCIKYEKNSIHALK